MIGAYEITLVAIVSINVMLALGLNLITGFCGQVSLGHAAFFGTGAYAAALLAGTGMPLVAEIAALWDAWRDGVPPPAMSR